MAAKTTKIADTVDDSSKLSFCKMFTQLPEKSAATLRFFDRNDYYTCHGDDAVFVAKEYFHTMGVLNHWGAAKLPSVNISSMVFENALRDLLFVRNYRVELYCHTGKGRHDWQLSKRASPGNIQMFEEQLFQSSAMNTSSIMMAVKIGGTASARVVGVAFADTALGFLHVSQFADNEQFSNLEAMVVQVGAKECLFSGAGGSSDLERVSQVIERSGLMQTNCKRADFDTRDIAQDLDRLLKLPDGTAAASLPEMDLQQAMGATACVIRYLDLLSNEDNFGQFTLKPFDTSRFMRLDAAAVRALNLLPSALDGGNKTQSLVGLLDHCKTAQGRRLIVQWVKQPLLDLVAIKERHDIVESLVDCDEMRMGLQDDCLRRFPDLNRLAKKFSRGKANLEDCVHVYQAVSLLAKFVETLRLEGGDHAPLLEEVFITPLEQHIADFANYLQLIEHTVDLEETDNRHYLIKASYNEALSQGRERMNQVHDRIPGILNKAAHDLGLEPHKAMKLEKDGKSGAFVFRVTRAHEKLLRGNRRYTTLETQKNGVKFVNAALQSVNDEYTELHEQYRKEQEKIVAEVLAVAAGYCEVMQMTNGVIAHLDVLVSFAHASINAPIPYVRPTMKPMEEGQAGINFTDCRHPCVEVQDDVNFMSNHVHMTRGSSDFQIITGPNMGGKSTYIRQIGVNVLMAQIGCFVPAKAADVCVVDSILARVGAGDSQLKGVSTFMAEMLETSSILKSATPNSLIIIDELGRGTSTYDGFGLAWAISEFIATQIGGFCLFATHFHELTALSDSLPNVRNMHVDALTTDGNLTLLYKVKPGVCDRSFGIHVAKMAEFPQEVVDHAKRKAIELEDFEGTGAAKEGLDEANKRRRDEKQEGCRLIDQFLAAAGRLDTAALTPDKVLEKVSSLKQDLMAKKNLFVEEVLGTASQQGSAPMET